MSHDSVVSAYTKLLTVDFRNVCVRTVKMAIREADRDVDAGHGDGAKPRCRRRGRRGRGPGPPLAVGGGDHVHDGLRLGPRDEHAVQDGDHQVLLVLVPERPAEEVGRLRIAAGR